MPGIGYGSIRAGTTSHENPKRKWWNLMPFLVALVVIAEISFLGKLDMAKNAALVNSWWSDSFSHAEAQGTETETTRFDGGSVEEEGSCERWLEREDALIYSRDFHKQPVLVTGADQDWKHCYVGCKFGHGFPGKHDAAFGPQENGIAGILRSMESAQYYAENNIAHARGRGYTVVMTTSLSSDVPVGYFSWAEYDIMAPVQEKTESALAAAFISNCGARNFRLQALEALERSEIKIDSYGGCHRNRDGKVDKVEALKHYKFSLAFENSNEEDYVTEKFFQSLVAVSDCWNKLLNSESIEYVGLNVGLYFHTGRPRTIPVVVGPPNIEEFAPCPGCVLHIKELADVSTVAKTMKYLAENPDAYNQSLRWKYEGPSDSFKALIDMAAVHSSCRLCIHLATQIREKEEKSHLAKKRPCKCSRGGQTVFHVYARERGRFEMESVFLRSSNLTLKGLEQAVLEKFKQLNHVPVWKQERPEIIRGGNVLKIHKIYPLGLTQRQALYTFRFQGDVDFRSHLLNNPCSKFEVIFV